MKRIVRKSDETKKASAAKLPWFYIIAKLKEM